MEETISSSENFLPELHPDLTPFTASQFWGPFWEKCPNDVKLSFLDLFEMANREEIDRENVICNKELMMEATGKTKKHIVLTQWSHVTGKLIGLLSLEPINNPVGSLPSGIHLHYFVGPEGTVIPAKPNLKYPENTSPEEQESGNGLLFWGLRKILKFVSQKTVAGLKKEREKKKIKQSDYRIIRELIVPLYRHSETFDENRTSIVKGWQGTAIVPRHIQSCLSDRYAYFSIPF